MNGQNQVYDLVDNNYTKYEYLQLQSELYDFKLKNKDQNNEAGPYSMCALVKYNTKITFLATQYNLDSSSSIGRDQDKLKELFTAKNHSQGYFNNYTTDFYFTG